MTHRHLIIYVEIGRRGYNDVLHNSEPVKVKFWFCTEDSLFKGLACQLFDYNKLPKVR